MRLWTSAIEKCSAFVVDVWLTKGLGCAGGLVLNMMLFYRSGRMREPFMGRPPATRPVVPKVFRQRGANREMQAAQRCEPDVVN